MELRAATVAAAERLGYSGMKFSDFKDARCNPWVWQRTELGGFKIREGVPPAAGIRDIFVNGSLYATECATATIIVVYKAVLDTIGDTQFNRLFDGLLLYDWQVDDDLRLIKRKGIESYPGDLLYINNPDFDPATPQWRGENVVKISDDHFYGHPLGVAPLEIFITGLNGVRRPGAFISAYLTDDVVYPDHAYLSQFAPGMRQKVIGRIGGKRVVD
ncbi:protein-glutamine gamma-glutamyltransferase [Cohnella sp. CFH 77786]|nr:protein-glutamine gamma-glutamyltransferase [Cohnella sp. CFH 77786]